jgi:hypothetical protein
LNNGHTKGTCWYNDYLCFVGIPKNASTAMRKSLGIENNHSNILLNGHSLKDRHVFTIIRDPLERFISGYHEAIFRQWHGVRVLGFSRQISKESFSRFLREAEKNKNKQQFDCHIDSQSYLLTGIHIDRFLIFEDLKNGFDSMCKDLNLSYCLTIHNSKQNTVRDYIKSFLEHSDKIRIMNLYENDYKLYNQIKGK